MGMVDNEEDSLSRFTPHEDDADMDSDRRDAIMTRFGACVFHACEAQNPKRNFSDACRRCRNTGDRSRTLDRSGRFLDIPTSSLPWEARTYLEFSSGISFRVRIDGSDLQVHPIAW
jgi:hypothetical protein